MARVVQLKVEFQGRDSGNFGSQKRTSGIGVAATSGRDMPELRATEPQDRQRLWGTSGAFPSLLCSDDGPIRLSLGGGSSHNYRPWWWRAGKS